MGKERLPLRVDPETKDALSEYAEEQDVSNSEAGRRMLRAGLSQSGYEVAVADGVGTVGEIEKLRNDLTEMEQRQVEYSERRRRAEFRQTVALLAGFAYIAATVILDISGLLWAATGVTGIIAMALTQWQLSKVSGDE